MWIGIITFLQAVWTLMCLEELYWLDQTHHYTGINSLKYVNGYCYWAIVMTSNV